MTLRTRLFLIVSGLVSLLVGAEWALVTALTEDLEDEAGSFALQVGGGVLHSLLGEDVNTFTVNVDPEEGSASRDVRAVVFTPARGDSGLLASPPTQRIVRRVERHRVEREITAPAAPTERFLRIVVGAGVHAAPPSPHGEVTVVHEGHPAVETRISGEWVGAARERSRSQPVIAIALGTSGGIGTFGDPSDLDLDLGGLFEFQTMTELDDLDLDVLVDGERGRSFLVKHEAGLLSWKSDPDSPGPPGPPGPPGAQADAGDASAAPSDAASGGPIEHSVPIPRAGFQDAVAGFLRRLWLGTIAIFALGLVVAGWVAHRVSVPLRRLSRAATEVGDGALGTQVPTEGDREVSATLAAFNRMSTRLRDLDDEARALREREHLTEIGEVARGMAHAMRNPLHLLGLSVDQLAARCADAGPEADALAVTARGQIQRVDRSLRTFLSLSSGAGGAAEPVRVDDLVRDVALELLQDGAATPVRVLADADDLAAVRAVAPELRAVVHVLIVNAVEASPADGEVVIRVRALDRGVRVEVDDEGSGLAPEVRAKLFTPHLSTKEQGAGMGLFLAHRIATSRYRGSLRLDPREPRGTRAVLELHDRNGDIHHG